MEQAIQSATQAVADDEAGKLEDAAMNYSKAIEFFSQALKGELHWMLLNVESTCCSGR